MIMDYYYCTTASKLLHKQTYQRGSISYMSCMV